MSWYWWIQIVFDIVATLWMIFISIGVFAAHDELYKMYKMRDRLEYWYNQLGKKGPW